MDFKTTYKLLIIVFLDSICCGLTYPFLFTHLLSLGADHVVGGILSVGCLLCKLLSSDLILFINNGKRLNLDALLTIQLISYLSLLFSPSYWVVIFGRYIYCFATSDSYNLYKILLERKVSHNDKGNILIILNILNGSGHIIGPILAGYLFNYGFLCISVTTTVLTSISLYMAKYSVDNTNIIIIGNENNANKGYRNLSNVASDWLNCDYRVNWDVMAIKMLYVSCISVYYSKFTLILMHNFNSTTINTGRIFAYKNMLVFTSTYIVSVIKRHYAPFSPITVMENCLKFLAVCLFISCFSPTYPVYVISCVPTIFLISLINSTWDELFAMRNNDSLARLIDSLETASGLTTPIAFGFTCNAINHYAYIMFTVIPIVLSVYVITAYSKKYVTREVDKKDN